MIRVAVTGAAGKMGVEVLRAVAHADDMELVAAVDRQRADEPISAVAGVGLPDLKIESRLGEALDRSQPHVLVDFTQMAAAPENCLSALRRGIAVVIGTSGLSAADLSAIRQGTADYNTPAALIPNFAVGAVLMMRFAELAAAWLPDVEIIEAHHTDKLDAPSGTATHTAERIAEARRAEPMVNKSAHEKHAGARGAKVKDVQVHSLRLPGCVAHQEVIFSGVGELLTIRHDSLDRRSFMEGVKLSIRRIRDHQGLIVGLDRLMFPPQ